MEQAIDAREGMRDLFQLILNGMLPYDLAQRRSLTETARLIPWLTGLLCCNEDLRYLVQQEGGDESWLREAALERQVAPQSPKSAESLLGGEKEADAGNLERSNDFVELAPDVHVAVPSQQPPWLPCNGRACTAVVPADDGVDTAAVQTHACRPKVPSSKD